MGDGATGEGEGEGEGEGAAPGESADAGSGGSSVDGAVAGSFACARGMRPSSKQSTAAAPAAGIDHRLMPVRGAFGAAL